MILHMAISDYIYALGGKSPDTKISAKRLLGQFADWCDSQGLDQLDQIKAVHVRMYAEHLRDRKLADNTQRTHMRRLKTFLNWCCQEDGYSDLVSEKMVKRIAMPTVEQKVMTIITPDQFKRLEIACGDSRFKGWEQRNLAILYLLYDTGIRISELCGITLDQVYFGDEGNFVRVFGKGRKQREVDFGAKTRKALRTYISRYRKADKNEQHLFISYQRGPLTVSGIEQVLHPLTDQHQTGAINTLP